MDLRKYTPDRAEAMAVPAQGPRRVLLISRVGFLGGVERVTLTLAERLLAYGWQAVIACPPDEPLAEMAQMQGTPVAACRFDRVRITANPRELLTAPFSWLRGVQAIDNVCRAGRFDLIHVHHPVVALYALPTARRLGVPILLHVHETLPAKALYAAALRLAAYRSTALVCVSEAARRLALAMGVKASRSHVVGNGVDRRFWEETRFAPPELVRKAGQGPHVGVFGVLEPRKAQHVFIQAAARIAKDFPSAHFWLIGETSFKDKDAYATELRALAEGPSLEGRVHMVGFQQEVRPWLDSLDIVVQPSVALESFGMALAEAAARGKPVIATEIGGMPEVVEHGVTGLIVRPNDSEHLASALSNLLANPSRRMTMGRAAARRAQFRFSPDVFARNMADIYDLVLAKSDPGRVSVRPT